VGTGRFKHQQIRSCMKRFTLQDCRERHGLAYAPRTKTKSKLPNKSGKRDSIAVAEFCQEACRFTVVLQGEPPSAGTKPFRRRRLRNPYADPQRHFLFLGGVGHPLPLLAPLRHGGSLERCLLPREDRKQLYDAQNGAIDPERSAPGSWQRIGGESPPRGRSSQPPRPRVMHEVLLARAAVKRSQGRPRAKY
jgi:hypothetical protein